MMVVRRWAVVLEIITITIAATTAAPMGFQGMRGKKALDYFQDLMLDEPDPAEQQYLPKRAPMGFQGMRGKKDPYLIDDYFDAADYKRAPMGFQGMRGKKFADYGFKRAPMGFQGMRGKKDIDRPGMPEEAHPLEELSAFTPLKQRRSPNYGFFGVRGKKMPSSSSFFGMRGKKGPFDYPFRGKFVGVRGKKAYDAPLFDDEAFDKRAPSGFVASRGKKRDVQDDENIAQEINKSPDVEK